MSKNKRSKDGNQTKHELNRFPLLIFSLPPSLLCPLTPSLTVSCSVCVVDINGTSLVCKCAKLCAPLQAVYYSRPLGQLFHMASHMVLSSIN